MPSSSAKAIIYRERIHQPDRHFRASGNPEAAQKPSAFARQYIPAKALISVELLDETCDALLAVFDDGRLFVERNVDYVFGGVGSDSGFVVAGRSVFRYAHFIHFLSLGKGNRDWISHLYAGQCKASVLSIHSFLLFCASIHTPALMASQRALNESEQTRATP